MLGNADLKRASGTEGMDLPLSEPMVAGPLPYDLLNVMQELSHARTLDTVIDLVRAKARELAQADGVAFVLRDGDQCHYVEENAIGPLWKGRKFPMTACISGWSMMNRKAVAIEDIYTDPRIPIDAYRVTFVKSLAVVPIRRSSPIGAIGIYWADHRIVGEQELAMLQALADSVSIAMENVALYTELQNKVRELQESNHELSRFAWVASHDLQEPLRTITTQVELLARRYSKQLDAQANGYITSATHSAKRLQSLVQDLLVHARMDHTNEFKAVSVSEIIEEVLRDMHMAVLQSEAIVTHGELPWIWAERVMLGRLFQNLISNAIKFAKPGDKPCVHISCLREEGFWHFMVADNGIGIEPEQCERIFGLFQRVHAQSVYPGSGIGLATCKKIAELHQGRIWVESTPGIGSTFHLLLPVTGEELPAKG